MSEYRTFRTTMGRKYKMRMTQDEKAEQELLRIVMVVTTFLGSALMMFMWIKMGG